MATIVEVTCDTLNEAMCGFQIMSGAGKEEGPKEKNQVLPTPDTLQRARNIFIAALPIA